jgi:hypothetical protein
MVFREKQACKSLVIIFIILRVLGASGVIENEIFRGTIVELLRIRDDMIAYYALNYNANQI